MGNPFPYLRTSEISEAWWWLPEPGLGKPGPYVDPGLYDVPGPAFAPLFSAETRLTQDAQAAAVQNDKPADLVSIFTGAVTAAKSASDDLIGAITHTWTDPDTGKVNFGTGPNVGPKWVETAGTVSGFLQQLPGLFNTGYEPAPGNVPTVPAMPAVGTLGGLPAWVILAGLGLLLFAGRRK